MSYMTVDLSQDDLQRATTLINLVKSQEASNDAFLLLDPLEYVCEKERKKLTEEQARPGRNEESPDSMFHSKFLAHGHMHMGRMNLLWCKLPAACRESPCKDAVLIYQWLSSLLEKSSCFADWRSQIPEMKKVTNSTNSLAELDLELEIMQRDYMAFSCDGPIYKKLNDFLAAVDEAEGKYRLILNLANCQV